MCLSSPLLRDFHVKTPPEPLLLSCKSENPASELLTQLQLQAHLWWAGELKKPFGVRTTYGSMPNKHFELKSLFQGFKRKVEVKITLPTQCRCWEKLLAMRQTSASVSLSRHRHQGMYFVFERATLGVPEMPYHNFQPVGNLKYLILFPFQPYLNFIQDLHPSLPLAVLQQLEILFSRGICKSTGGIYFLLRDRMYTVCFFTRHTGLNSFVLDLGMFPTSEIVCFNKYSSGPFNVIQNI